MKTCKFLYLVPVCFLLASIFSCERKTSPVNPNLPPNTTLANIPVENDTLFALVTLHWDGEDDDGYIEGFEYRYITNHLFAGDSVVKEWIRTKATSVTIPFESSDSLNYQRFQVRAIDNHGEVDPTPAQRLFFTVRTITPVTEILFPESNQQFFAIEQVTDWWQGIQLTFHASDQDGEVTEYAWAVDDGDWNWSPDTSLFIPPEYFTPLNGDHKLRVTSRDNTNLVDPVGAVVSIKLVQPTFEKKILIIDETVESKFPAGMRFTDDAVDAFYAEIFGTDESWDFQAKKMPSKDILGQYQLTVWHADNLYTNENDVHRLPEHIIDIMDYMNVGGDFIMSGWRILKSFAVGESFPKFFQEGTFIHDYLHINQADESAPIADFTWAKGYGFSNIRVDSIKLSESFFTTTPVIGLMYVNLMPRAAGFTDVIFRYQNDDYTGLPAHRFFPCGLRYYGTSFNAIVLGFPIFLINQEDAKTMAAEMLHSMGY